MHSIRLETGEEVLMDRQSSKEYNDQIKRLKFIRGNFLEMIIQIETYIDRIVEKSLLPEDSIYKHAFLENFLYSRKVSLSDKNEFLLSILMADKCLTEEELEQFKKFSKELITERNKFAHGSIFYRPESRTKFQPYLQYVDANGKLNEQKLDDDYFSMLTKKLNLIKDFINTIQVKKKCL